MTAPAKKCDVGPESHVTPAIFLGVRDHRMTKKADRLSIDHEEVPFLIQHEMGIYVSVFFLEMTFKA